MSVVVVVENFTELEAVILILCAVLVGIFPGGKTSVDEIKIFQLSKKKKIFEPAVFYHFAKVNAISCSTGRHCSCFLFCRKSVRLYS